jgi:hypothetical protein
VPVNVDSKNSHRRAGHMTADDWVLQIRVDNYKDRIIEVRWKLTKYLRSSMP